MNLAEQNKFRDKLRDMNAAINALTERLKCVEDVLDGMSARLDGVGHKRPVGRPRKDDKR